MGRHNSAQLLRKVANLHVGQMVILNVLGLLAGGVVGILGAIVHDLASEFMGYVLLYVAGFVSLSVMLSSWWVWFGGRDRIKT